MKVGFLLSFEQVASSLKQNIFRGVPAHMQRCINKNNHSHGDANLDCFMCDEVQNGAALQQCKNLLQLQKYLHLGRV
jgi:hypothetical protein